MTTGRINQVAAIGSLPAPQDRELPRYLPAREHSSLFIGRAHGVAGPGAGPQSLKAFDS